MHSVRCRMGRRGARCKVPTQCVEQVFVSGDAVLHSPPGDYAKPLTDSRKLIKWNRLRQVVQTGSQLLIWVKFVCIVCYHCACELYWAASAMVPVKAQLCIQARQKAKREENKLSKRGEGIPLLWRVSGLKWSPPVPLFCTASWLKAKRHHPQFSQCYPCCHCLKAPSPCKTKTGRYVAVQQSQRN